MQEVHIKFSDAEMKMLKSAHFTAQDIAESRIKRHLRRSMNQRAIAFARRMFGI